MNPPQVYTCSSSWTLLPPPSPYHPSGSSQCTSPKHPVSCIEPGLAIHFIYDITHVSMPFSHIIPPSPLYARQQKRHRCIEQSFGLCGRERGWDYLVCLLEPCYRHTHLNAELQRIARRDKKAFLSDQCKEIEENNRTGKMRSLQENQRHQGNIPCKHGLKKGKKW